LKAGLAVSVGAEAAIGQRAQLIWLDYLLHHPNMQSYAI